MDDDADTFCLWDDLGLAHIDNGAQDPRVRQRQGGHLLRKGLHEMNVPLRRRPQYQLVDQVRVRNVIANVIRARCCGIGNEHVDRDRYFLPRQLLALVHADGRLGSAEWAIVH